MRTVPILGTIVLILGTSTHARDPNVPYEPPHEWGERETVGGSKWSGGDTFIAIALPVAVVMLIALPKIFDGETERWPVWKFNRALSAHYPLIIRSPKLGKFLPILGIYKFPTRSLCGSY